MYRFSVKHRGRLTNKASATQHVAYILRDTEGPAAGHVQYMLRANERTRGREDLIASGHGNLPSWAHDNPTAFFEQAERGERANGRTATTWEVTLPRAMPREIQLAAIEDLMQTQFGKEHVYVWALHEAQALDGGLNPHFHVAFSSRTLDGLDRSAEQFFRRYNPEAPEKGGAKKSEHLHDRGMVERQRMAWAIIANWHLEQAGVDARIDHRTLLAQGIEREPTTRLPSQDLTQAKYARKYSDKLQERKEQGGKRAADKPYDNARAARAWEERKTALGITSPMSRETVMSFVTAQTRQPFTKECKATRAALALS